MAFSVCWMRISLMVHSASFEMRTLSMEDCGSKSALNASTVSSKRDCSLASSQRLAVRPWVSELRLETALPLPVFGPVLCLSFLVMTLRL